MSVAPLQFLLLVFAGWVNRRQLEIVEYLQEENRVLREQLGDQRLRFTDAQRRRLATKGKALGRRTLEQLAGLVTPDTILRWYRELVAKKYDGTARRGCRGPGTAASLQRLVVQFATENPRYVKRTNMWTSADIVAPRLDRRGLDSEANELLHITFRRSQILELLAPPRSPSVAATGRPVTLHEILDDLLVEKPISTSHLCVQDLAQVDHGAPETRRDRSAYPQSRPGEEIM